MLLYRERLPYRTAPPLGTIAVDLDYDPTNGKRKKFKALSGRNGGKILRKFFHIYCCGTLQKVVQPRVYHQTALINVWTPFDGNVLAKCLNTKHAPTKYTSKIQGNIKQAYRTTVRYIELPGKLYLCRYSQIKCYK